MRVIQLDPNTGNARYYKNVVDIQLLPPKKDCSLKYSHDTEAWSSRIHLIAEKFEIAVKRGDGKKLLAQACAFDNCTTARSTARNCWLLQLWCACHRTATSCNKTKEAYCKLNPAFKQQSELRSGVIVMMNYGIEAFATDSETRTWCAANRQDCDLVKKWEKVQTVADFTTTEMPSKNFIDDHKEVTDRSAVCFHRMEKKSALCLESVNSYILIRVHDCTYQLQYRVYCYIWRTLPVHFTIENVDEYL